MKRGAYIFFVMVIATVAATLFSCRRVPDGVVSPDKMAGLMADMRMADAVVSVRRSDFPNEASRMALKNAVLDRHGVSEAEFDSSIVWYGKNIDLYQEVTQKSIDILEKRLKDLESAGTASAAMTVSGDSVDIWDGPRAFSITEKTPTRFIVFNFESDHNWEPGDIYTFRSRLLTPVSKAEWNLMTEYTDGAIETITMNLMRDNPERQELTLITDSTRTASTISGWLYIDPHEGHVALVDSISLVRNRTSPELARTRKYQQKKIIPKNEQGDSIIE